MENSQYQIGDVVTIKKLLEEDALSGKYRFGLNGEMIAVSGKSFKIKYITTTSARPGEVYDDGYCYRLDGVGWSWASSMFEDTTIGESIKDESITIDSFINKKKCPVLDFALH